MGYATLLAAVTASRHWTMSDGCDEFDKTARSLGLPHTVSLRQWERWCGGHVKSLPRPGCQRVLEAMFDRSIEELFGPPGSPLPTGCQVGSAGGLGSSWDEPDKLGEVIAMSAEESARFGRTAGRNNIGAGVLDQLNSDVRGLAVAYLSRPPLLVYPRIVRLRSDVFDLLDGRQRPAETAQLYLAAGRLCALLAHACADLGYPDAADAHARTAWLCADMIDHHPLRVYTRWVQSNVAYWRGEYADASRIAADGQRFATSGTSMLRLSSQRARAAASMGLTDEVDLALRAATNARGDVVDEEPGVMRFGPGKAAYYASEAHLALGGDQHLRESITRAEDALTILAEAPPVDQCREFTGAARLDLTGAHLARGDLDAVADHLGQVLATAPEYRTHPIVRRCADVGGRLRRSRSRLAADLVERVELFCAYSAHRELPAVEGE